MPDPKIVPCKHLTLEIDIPAFMLEQKCVAGMMQAADNIRKSALQTMFNLAGLSNRDFHDVTTRRN